MNAGRGSSSVPGFPTIHKVAWPLSSDLDLRRICFMTG